MCVCVLVYVCMRRADSDAGCQLTPAPVLQTSYLSLCVPAPHLYTPLKVGLRME